ncbi:MAG: hypothetical protein WDN67_00720 [Candidatus Moraniibacteriota bacterium]
MLWDKTICSNSNFSGSIFSHSRAVHARHPQRQILTNEMKKMKKSYLKKILKNPNDQLVAVDMDGTLCLGEYWGRPEDSEPIPNESIVKMITDLYQNGAHIVLYNG